MAAGQPEVPSGVEVPLLQMPLRQPQPSAPVGPERPDHPTAAAQTTFIKPATACMPSEPNGRTPEFERPSRNLPPRPIRSTEDLSRIGKGSAGREGFYTEDLAGPPNITIESSCPVLATASSAVSGASMAFIAVAIPILVVLVASMVYLRYGRVQPVQGKL